VVARHASWRVRRGPCLIGFVLIFVICQIDEPNVLSFSKVFLTFCCAVFIVTKCKVLTWRCTLKGTTTPYCRF